MATMMEQLEKRAGFRRLFVALALVLSLFAQSALAEWDAQRFGELLVEADEKFTSGAYDEAIPIYLELKLRLENALAKGDIAEDRRDSVEQALGSILYQLGRSLQLTGDCSGAYAAFRGLGSDKLTDSVRTMLSMRMAETKLCLAQDLVESDDLEAAAVHLDDANVLLREFDHTEVTAVLGEEKGKLLHDEWEQARGRYLTSSEQLFTRYTKRVETAMAAGQCADALRVLSRLDVLVTPSLEAQYAPIKKKVKAECSADHAGDPTVAKEDKPKKDEDTVVTQKKTDPPPPTSSPAGPWVLIGIGGAALLADGILEGVMASRIDDYDAARAACDQGEPRCKETAELADEITAARWASIALLAGGGTLAITGLVWWLVSDDEEVSTSVNLLPQPGGATVLLTLELP